jgi:hypothetical protein
LVQVFEAVDLSQALAVHQENFPQRSPSKVDGLDLQLILDMQALETGTRSSYGR